MDESATDRSPNPPVEEKFKRLILCSGKVTPQICQVITGWGCMAFCASSDPDQTSESLVVLEYFEELVRRRCTTTWPRAGRRGACRRRLPLCAWNSWRPSPSTWSCGSCAAIPRPRSCGEQHIALIGVSHATEARPECLFYTMKPFGCILLRGLCTLVFEMATALPQGTGGADEHGGFHIRGSPPEDLHQRGGPQPHRAPHDRICGPGPLSLTRHWLRLRAQRAAGSPG